MFSFVPEGWEDKKKYLQKELDSQIKKYSMLWTCGIVIPPPPPQLFFKVHISFLGYVCINDENNSQTVQNLLLQRHKHTQRILSE